MASVFGISPGIGITYTAAEAAVWSATQYLLWQDGEYLVSTAVDAGNSPTTKLRPGLVLAKRTSDGLLDVYSATGTNGTNVAYAVLYSGVDMLDGNGVAASKEGKCPVKPVLLAWLA